MATTFLEPGGDADFAVTTTNGFWKGFGGVGTPTIVTDFVHGNHIKSIKYAANSTQSRSSSTLVIAGSRFSAYIYIVALPSATVPIFKNHTTAGLDQDGFTIRLTSTGVLQIWSGDAGTPAQIGSNGSTLSTGTWYRISLAYTYTNNTTNRFELFKNGVSDISITNATLNGTTGINWVIGNTAGNSTLDFRSSDHYADNSTALTDPGNIWVTAKRPNANGTANNFNVQIGSGGSGYGTGHSPQVNERPLDTADGWSVVAVAATTEEYNIENLSTGDFDLTGATIVDYMGWVSAKTLNAETGSIVVNGASSNISLTTTITMFLKVAGSATYPAGTGADIGIVTTSLATTVSLYEAGIVVAFIPAVVANTSNMFLVM